MNGNNGGVGTSGTSRRGVLRASLAGGLVLGAGVRAPAVLAQTTAPVRVGMLNSFSKSGAVVGVANVNAMTLFFEQIGWQAGGRRIEFVREDDDMNPQVGLQKLKKLVESDRVDFVCGPQLSNIAMAMVGYMKQSRAFWLCSGAGVTQLTWERMPYMFRTSCSVWQHNAEFGGWFYKNVAKEVILTASDYTGGRDTVGEFKQSFVRNGGRVVREIYPPLNTNDFSSYLLDLKSSNVPASFSFYSGTDAIRFVKQYAEYGLRERIKLTGSGFMVESDTLPAQGAAALGVISSLHYADTLDNPENRKFVADYRARFNEYPNVTAEYGYVTAQVIAKALEATGGNTQDKDKLAAAVAALSFNAPRGPFRFDPVTHNPIMNVYIREVAEIEGRLTNRVIATIENVRDPGTRPS
ncbi:ABC transporter substrate-binding protein [Roseomonas sp. BN140053]|uniref:ABC transporter substrate-binding protein n=1 Tax=Roseomonas sp. BN140053 TaxID=3391898 RepID=UPI0039E8DDC1